MCVCVCVCVCLSVCLSVCLCLCACVCDAVMYSHSCCTEGHGRGVDKSVVPWGKRQVRVHPPQPQVVPCNKYAQNTPNLSHVLPPFNEVAWLRQQVVLQRDKDTHQNHFAL